MGLKNVGVVEEQDAFGQGVSFYFMAYLSAYGGLISDVHAFQPGKGDCQAAVADMLKGKATGLDGVYIATNDLAFLAGEAAAAEECRLGLQGLYRQASPLPGDSQCMLAPTLNIPILLP